MPKFEKGKSGNPKGRPKGSITITGLLKKIGNETIPIKFQQQVKKLFPDVDTTNLTMNEAVARFTFIYAMQGKSWAVTHLTDRTEGKAVERTADITEEWKELFEALNQPE